MRMDNDCGFQSCLSHLSNIIIAICWSTQKIYKLRKQERLLKHKWLHQMNGWPIILLQEWMEAKKERKKRW